MKMAGQSELDQFIRKFVSLWKSGWEASLHMESRAGKAFVNLQLGLGQAQQHSGKSDHVGVHRGGSPSKQRRRDRREADREAKAVAEQAAAAQNVGSHKNNAAVEQADLERPSLVTEEVTIDGNEIPQVDGVNDDGEVVASEDIEYELKVDAHTKCKNYDVIEAIEVNFDGTLDELKVEKNDSCRNILVQKLEKKLENNDEERQSLMYRVVVKNCKVAEDILESWKERHKFDDLGFRNYVYGVVNVRIKEVQKL